MIAITRGTDRTSNTSILNEMIDWEQVRIEAAISAMQGVLESGKLGEILEAAPDVVARQSVKLADALVKELKKSAKDTDK